MEDSAILTNKKISLHISQQRCTGCEACFEKCPHKVIGMVYKEEKSYATIERIDRCVGCNRCVKACKVQAIELSKHKKTNRKKNMRKNMKKSKKALFALAFVAVFAAAIAVVMLLWNLLIPSIIGWSAINYWQAAGLMILCRLLFSGFGRGGHKRGGRGRHFFGGGTHHELHAELHERMKSMSREERKEFIRQRMKDHHGHGHHHHGDRHHGGCCQHDDKAPNHPQQDEQ